MNRNLLLSAAVAATILSGSAAAQRPEGAPRAGRFAGRAALGLNLLRLPPAVEAKLALTADQKAKLEAIRARLREGVRRGEPGGDRRAARQQIRADLQKAEAEALAVLTETQKKQWEALKAQQIEFAGLGRAGAGLLAVSGLTAEQTAKLKALAAANEAKLRDARQALRQGGDRQAALRELQALQQQTQASVRQILTPEQQKQYEAAMAALAPASRRAARREET